MPTTFWIKRFFTVTFMAFVVLAAFSLLRGRTPAVAAMDSAVWGIIVGCILVATRIYRSRLGQACPICKDTPEAKRLP